uniref:Protein OSCP1 n=1 Tax=Timema poppense TaxID=170557 RepID=A0A7R9GZX6_TIMPO|nr:unnamed protein product [Timema poppensis]
MTSINTIPLLFLNLGGEMMYILDQRLQAQKIPKDKSMKVMNEITSIMLNEKFLGELFKPQEVYNKQALRKLFEDLAHGSIMRLNSASMDKLYDLMTMVFKYQVFNAQSPNDVVLITLNHLDSIRNFVTCLTIQKQVDMAHSMVMKMYGKMSPGELQTIRYSLLNFFQDLKVRVSVLLRVGAQNSHGDFIIYTSGAVPPGCEVPGFIRLFDQYGAVAKVKHFNADGDYTAARDVGSMELIGDRVIELGCNINSPLYERSSLNAPPPPHCLNTPLQEETKVNELLVGREELNLLLAQLLGHRVQHQSDSKDIIRLNLFSCDLEEDDIVAQQNEPSFVNFDARNPSHSAELDKIYNEMTLTDSTVESPSVRSQCQQEEEDLLDLLENS